MQKLFIVLSFVLALVFVSGVKAQDTTAGEVEVAAEDVTLASSPSTEGFGLTIQNWFEDIQERFARNQERKLELTQLHAERALARLEAAAEEGDEKALAKLEAAKARYEVKLAKLEDLSENDEGVREHVLAMISKHEAVLERVLENAPESAQSGLGRALENAQIHRDRMLEKFSEEERSGFKSALEAKKERIKVRLEQINGQSDGEDGVESEVETQSGGAMSEEDRLQQKPALMRNEIMRNNQQTGSSDQLAPSAAGVGGSVPNTVSVDGSAPSAAGVGGSVEGVGNRRGKLYWFFDDLREGLGL